MLIINHQIIKKNTLTIIFKNQIHQGSLKKRSNFSKIVQTHVATADNLPFENAFDLIIKDTSHQLSSKRVLVN